MMNNTEWDKFMARLKALPPLNNKPRPVDTDFWREMDAMQTSHHKIENQRLKASH